MPAGGIGRSFQVGWRLFLDFRLGCGLAVPIMSGLLPGLNGKAAAEYTYSIQKDVAF